VDKTQLLNPARMAAECRRRWEEIIASGRAFRMPTVVIGAEAAEPPPNNVSRVPCTAAQALSGTVRIGTEAVGFAQEGDSADYTLDVVTQGRYTVTVHGEGSDTCAPLSLAIGGNILQPQKSWNGAAHFGTVALAKGETPLRIAAGKPRSGATLAKRSRQLRRPEDRDKIQASVVHRRCARGTTAQSGRRE
jgi:hypothetical protein